MRYDFYGYEFKEKDFIQSLNVMTQQQNYCGQRFAALK